MLNPAFNIDHMRDMIPIFYEITHKVLSTSSQTNMAHARLTW